MLNLDDVDKINKTDIAVEITHDYITLNDYIKTKSDLSESLKIFDRLKTLFSYINTKYADEIEIKKNAYEFSYEDYKNGLVNLEGFMDELTGDIENLSREVVDKIKHTINEESGINQELKERFKHKNSAAAQNLEERVEQNVQLDLDPKSGIRRLNELINKDPNNFELYIERADENIYFKRFSAAIDDCNVAILLNENCAEAYYKRGIAKYNSGGAKDAIEDCDRALELRQDILFYKLRAESKEALGQFEEAIADYNEIIKLDSENVIAYLCLGELKYGLRDLRGAINDFEKSMELGCGNHFNHIGIASLKLEAGLPEEAIKDYNKVIEQFNNNITHYSWCDIVGLHICRGFSKQNAGKFEEAIKDYNEVTGFYTPSEKKYIATFLYKLRAESKERLGKFEEAIKDYDEVIRLHPEESMFAHKGRGNAECKLHKFGEAKRDCKNFIELKFCNKKEWPIIFGSGVSIRNRLVLSSKTNLLGETIRERDELEDRIKAEKLAYYRIIDEHATQGAEECKKQKNKEKSSKKRIKISR